MPTKTSKGLHGLLDRLVALRMEVASGNDKDLSSLGREKVLQVQANLDAAIDSTKRAIGDAARPLPQKSKPART